jgi:CRP/FNR family transcriptional regulator
VYLLCEGYVKIATTSEEGKEVIKYLIKPGKLFGEMILLEDSEHEGDYAVALQDAVISFIDTEKLKSAIKTDLELRKDIFFQLATRIKQAETRWLSMTFHDAFTRVCDFIVDFTLDFGTKRGKAMEVNNFLTHDDIAKLTATSRQTVSRIFNYLRKQNMLEYNTDVIRIPFSSSLWKTTHLLTFKLLK